MIMFDYWCGKCQSVTERLVSRETAESQSCDLCRGDLVKCFPAPKGYVKDSDNPVKQ